MTDHKTRFLKGLNLSWPESVKYHDDRAKTIISGNSSGNQEAKLSDISSQKPATTYNGIPHDLLREEQSLIGDEIRVLDLRKGMHGDPLSGSLRKVRLSDPIIYEPLSYTWEDYDTVKHCDKNSEDAVQPTIFLSGVGRFVDIRTNCAKALGSVRKPTTDRTIWVDSICVNQDDPEERSRQVDLMQQIYSRALTVLVYLGEESTEDDSNLAMSLLGQRGLSWVNQDGSRSVSHLFKRPYFQRMWIVQEVALAQNLELYCGAAITHISTFAKKPLEKILGSGLTHPPWLRHSRHAANSLSMSQTTSQAEHILTLIFDTASCHCSDDRDRIFALLSLLNPGDCERPRADYTLASAQVYTGVAAYLATNGFLWGVLMLAQRSVLVSSMNLPSWVPDWNVLRSFELQFQRNLNLILSKSYQVGPLQPDVVVTSSGVITIRGICLGLVNHAKALPNYISPHNKSMHQDEVLTRLSYDSRLKPFQYRMALGHESTWTLTRPNQDTPQNSWECHFEFLASGKQPSNTKHIAVMLPDYSTVLILGYDDDSVCDQYTLVAIGVPFVSVVLPEEWALYNHKCIQVSPEMLFPRHLEPRNLECILSSQDVFPRLRDYPALWAQNPATSAMSLTYGAIQQIRSIDLIELSLWPEWQKHAICASQTLEDKNELQVLIDHVNSLKREVYNQMEFNAGLHPPWSLEDFLCLLIRNPVEREPMLWPDTQSHGEQPLGGTAALWLLMQWAEITYRLFRQLQAEFNHEVPWLKLPMGGELFQDAMAVIESHSSNTRAAINNDISRGKDRASFMLQRILSQNSGVSELEKEQEIRPLREEERYWDRRKFTTTMQQRFCILARVQPDVDKLQANFQGFEPDFRYGVAHQALAAHGIDPNKKTFSRLRIR